MPNVEFFGLDRALALNKKAKIEKMLRSHPCLNDMVFTIHSETEVIDKDENPQPFIRLTSTPRKDIPEIIEKLQELGVDIEIMKLERFIPAKK